MKSRSSNVFCLMSDLIFYQFCPVSCTLSLRETCIYIPYDWCNSNTITWSKHLNAIIVIFGGIFFCQQNCVFIKIQVWIQIFCQGGYDLLCRYNIQYFTTEHPTSLVPYLNYWDRHLICMYKICLTVHDLFCRQKLMLQNV